MLHYKRHFITKYNSTAESAYFDELFLGDVLWPGDGAAGAHVDEHFRTADTRAVTGLHAQS